MAHDESSSYNSSSNGGGECGIKRVKNTLKRVIEAGGDIEVALSEMRNFKSAHSQVSAAEIFFRRNVRGRLPALPNPVDYEKTIAQKDLQLQERLANMATRTLPSTELKEGTPVVIQDPVTREWRRKAVVLGRRGNGQSYWLADKFGDRFVRNRIFLKVDTALLQISEQQPRSSPYKPQPNPACHSMTQSLATKAHALQLLHPVQPREERSVPQQEPEKEVVQQQTQGADHVP